MEVVDQIPWGRGFIIANNDKTLITSGMSANDLMEEEESQIFSIP